MNKVSCRTDRQALIVLGMHRSGTSSLAGVLSHLGADAAKTLMKGDSWNERGYWESDKLVSFHDRLLASAGSSWDDWCALNPTWVSSSEEQIFLTELPTLIEQEFGQSRFFVVKDPRMCRFVPFWIRGLREIGVTPQFIISLRNPLEVARSLERRDGMPISEGLLLWLRHYLDAEYATRGHPRGFIQYEDLLRDWKGSIAALSTALNLQFPDQSSDTIAAVDAFLSRDLRHHIASPHELDAHEEVFDWTKRTYHALQRLIGGNVPEAMHELDDIRQAFDQTYIIFDGIIQRHKIEVDALTREIKGLNDKLNASADERDELSDQLNRRTADYRRIYHALLHARARPFKTLRRFVRWKSCAAFLVMERVLPDAMAARMRRGMQKASPVPESDFPVVDVHSVTGQRRFRQQERKYKVSRFILRFRRILPTRVAFRMQRRLEKNAPLPMQSMLTPGESPTHSTAPARDGVQNLRHMQISPSARDYLPLDTSDRLVKTAIRAIAFYLPQFHPIPENDSWWGKGFTEWTNVSKAVPQFARHYQPRLPGELGFYDLRLVEVQKRQIELAKQYGLYGFCFHYYWFTGGKRLLERPLNQYMAHKELDFPFCICWANENWTRRWDGSEHEVLMEQRYAPEDDLEIIKDMEPLLRDPRYIKVDGRPLIIVYRVTLLPDPKRTAETWRNYCRNIGLGDPILVAAQSFGIGDPRPYGFDAAVEFLPHGVSRSKIRNLDLYNPHYAGKVYDYQHIAKMAKSFEWPDYKLFKGIFPSWDNEARRPGRGHVFFGATPGIYRDWLTHLCEKTNDRYDSPDEKLVFINAWNEWGEGAYLEPDRGYGYAYLAATRDALESVKPTAVELTSTPLILVSHDALTHGAQFLALNIARMLSADMHRRIEIILLGGGPLKAEFEKYGTTHELSDVDGPGAAALVRRLKREGCEAAICNTTVSGHLVPLLKSNGIRVLSLIHELPGVVDEYRLHEVAREIAQHADKVVFPAPIVADGFEKVAKIDRNKCIIRPQGLYKKNRFRTNNDIVHARHALRDRFGLAPETSIILSVGHVSERKATDLFVAAALHVLKQRNDVFFLWVGPNDIELTDKLRRQIKASGYESHFAFSGVEMDTDPLYAGADIYALTSREDPFPSVVMEALDAGLPVVAFASAVGNLDLVTNAGGTVVPAFNIEAYAAALLDFLAHPIARAQVSATGRTLVEKKFSFRHYVDDLLTFCGEAPPRVSVVVPNYNYAHLLAERIATIAHQTFPVHELIFLDDASTDESLAVAQRELGTLSTPVRIVANEKNSGSVFRQWLRGVEQATGDYIWIAEADDLSDPSFLAEVMPAFSDPGIAMSYCQSKQIGDDGRILAENYLAYVSEISRTRWQSAYVSEGRKEISASLAIKNTIPNVSAVVFRKEILLEVLRTHCDEITSYRIAGDWLVYAFLLENGKLAYSPKALNLHRRHDAGVTMGSNLTRHLSEIISVQARLRELYPELNRQTEAADAYARKIQKQFGLNGDIHDYLPGREATEEKMT